MQENKIAIIIDKPIEEVFKFTTNPKNTPLWISSITMEVAEEYPPKVGTIYKNKGDDSDWDFYKVIEFEVNKRFTLSDLEGNYHVRYSYRKINDNQTEMEYFEWVKIGEIENPFTEDIIQKLKKVMESN
jgi:uncharacterized protein YndB with AHSA1/START domain